MYFSSLKPFSFRVESGVGHKNFKEAFGIGRSTPQGAVYATKKAFGSTRAFGAACAQLDFGAVC
ncbi:MAG: hypothetical protein OXC26_17920 [Albidovulum sp.]|nr:hypothetical protein [Albidovulum sp.]